MTARTQETVKHIMTTNPTSSRAPAILLAALLVSACGHDASPETEATSPDGDRSPYATGRAALEAGSRVDLVFGERQVGSTSGLDGDPLRESLDGQLLDAGSRVETSRLVLPPDVALGQELTLDEIGGIASLKMVRAENVIDFSALTGGTNTDPLCASSQPFGDGPERFCGRRWISAEYEPGSSDADVRLRIDELDVRPGGRVKLWLHIPYYRHVFPGAAQPLFCCASNGGVLIDATLDGELRFVAPLNIGAAYGTSVQCQYASLVEARGDAACGEPTEE